MEEIVSAVVQPRRGSVSSRLRQVSRRLLVGLAFLVVGEACAAECEELFRPYGWVNPEFATANITRGKIVATRPVMTTDFGLGYRLGQLGYVNLGYWSLTDLSRRYRGIRRNFVNEFDPWVMYGYEWNIAEGWSLDSRFSYQWDEMIGYRGGATRTYREGINRETLKTPWFSVYSLVRWIVHPYTCPGIRVGIYREIPLVERISFLPHFFVDGGPRCWNQRRFGHWTATEAHYRSGVNSATLTLLLKYALTDTLSVYGGVTQFGLVDSGIREQVKARPGDCARRDLTVGVVGLAWQF